MLYGFKSSLTWQILVINQHDYKTWEIVTMSREDLFLKVIVADVNSFRNPRLGCKTYKKTIYSMYSL